MGRVDVMEGNTVVLNCTSLVPSVPVQWSGPVSLSNPILTLANIALGVTGLYTCTVAGTGIYPSTLERSFAVLVVVYPCKLV